MPESVILNESAAWNDEIQDSLTPDYGFTRNRANTRAMAKPPGGRSSSRETSNTGHVFSLGWLNRSWKCAQRLKQFYEQYEDGFFTIIDHDGGGRHYVGNFAGNFPIVQRGNDSYDISGLTFQEQPGVPMLEYPADWDNDAVTFQPVDDYGDLKLYVSGVWAQQNQVDVNEIPRITMVNAGTNGGDFATYEYRGYGFRLWMVKGPNYGQVQLLLDNVDMGTFDLYDPHLLGPQVVLEQARAMLDLHRLKVVVLGTKNIASTAAAVVWCKLEVMR